MPSGAIPPALHPVNTVAQTTTVHAACILAASVRRSEVPDIATGQPGEKTAEQQACQGTFASSGREREGANSARKANQRRGADVLADAGVADDVAPRRHGDAGHRCRDETPEAWSIAWPPQCTDAYVRSEGFVMYACRRACGPLTTCCSIRPRALDPRNRGPMRHWGARTVIRVQAESITVDAPVSTVRIQRNARTQSFGYGGFHPIYRKQCGRSLGPRVAVDLRLHHGSVA